MNTAQIVTDIRAVDAWHKCAMVGFASILRNSAFDLNNKGVFAYLVKVAIENYDVAPAEIANKFGIDGSTVNRWSAGRNAPHPMVRPLVIDWIRECIAVKAENIKADTALIEQPRRVAFGG